MRPRKKPRTDKKDQKKELTDPSDPPAATQAANYEPENPDEPMRSAARRVAMDVSSRTKAKGKTSATQSIEDRMREYQKAYHEERVARLKEIQRQEAEARRLRLTEDWNEDMSPSDGD
ncbi:hypothetical protein JX266_003387 [Neoarthrinium moseri]|nr:hypothetical protein JX266_003387 [Neoarthrinium moseri]